MGILNGRSLRQYVTLYGSEFRKLMHRDPVSGRAIHMHEQTSDLNDSQQKYSDRNMESLSHYSYSGFRVVYDYDMEDNLSSDNTSDSFSSMKWAQRNIASQVCDKKQVSCIRSESGSRSDKGNGGVHAVRGWSARKTKGTVNASAEEVMSKKNSDTFVPQRLRCLLLRRRHLRRLYHLRRCRRRLGPKRDRLKEALDLTVVKEL